MGPLTETGPHCSSAGSPWVQESFRPAHTITTTTVLERRAHLTMLGFFLRVVRNSNSGLHAHSVSTLTHGAVSPAPQVCPKGVLNQRSHK